MEALQIAIGTSDLFRFYEIKETLGKGQFGQVKLAIHKRTGKSVAIKTVKKKDMKAIEIFQQRREIDVLKMSQHENIIRLIDVFETCDFYYIVLEYMEGKDMFEYIQTRGFTLPEDRVKSLCW